MWKRQFPLAQNPEKKTLIQSVNQIFILVAWYTTDLADEVHPPLSSSSFQNSDFLPA